MANSTAQRVYREMKSLKAENLRHGSRDCMEILTEVKHMLLRNLCLSAMLVVALRAQTTPRIAPQPLYRVTIVQRTTPAINYSLRSTPTKIDFRGTPLLPDAHGE